MTAQLSREELQIIADTDHVQCGDAAAMARMLLAGMGSEPVAWIVHARQGDMLTSDGNFVANAEGISSIRSTPLYAAPPAQVAEHSGYFASLVTQARARADKAMRKFPQPNYVLNKVAEESGEVIKAVIHYTEGREEWRNVEGEIIDNLAMLIRLVQEGDQVIGFTPPTDCRAAMLKAGPVTAATVPNDTKRLDWLDAQNKRLNEYYGTSYGWKFDANFQRNAMMLNDSNYPVMTVRQAIDEAMLAAAPAAPEQEV